VAIGSGGTAAGIALGIHLSKLQIKVTAISGISIF
jgi:1-aminocyclopropane-1-carboxylate deaminase/D-cysteine desulfhydrase-like pyridoxal-dependent ACC family enzyme